MKTQSFDSRLSQIVKKITPYTLDFGKKEDYKFNANTPPFPPPSLARLLQDLATECPINEYPDPTYRTLREKLSEYESVPVEMITITDSGDEAIDVVAKATLDDQSVLITAPPTFELFAEVSEINRGKHIPVPLLPETFAVDIEKIITTAKDTNARLIFLCNPNNPTGSVTSTEDIERILRQVSCTVVVDEVYREFYGQSVVPLLSQYDNLVVLRSFSKFAGIAGARVGYLITNPALSTVCNTIRFPMGVSLFSAKIAEYVLTYDRQWIKDTVALIISERERMTAAVRDIGYQVYPSQANFFLVRFGENAQEIYSQLKSRGILIRDRSSKQYLAGCARISVRSPQENDVLIAALRALRQKGTDAIV